MVDANPFALYGCSDVGINIYDWNIMFWILGIIWLWYSVVVMLSPFNLLPQEGMMKYGWLHFFSAIKEGGAFEREWTTYGSIATFIAGCNMAGTGLFFIWASDQHEDLTFFVPASVLGGLQLIAWLHAWFRFRDEFKPMLYAWAVSPIITLAVSIAVVTDQDTDLKQLKSDKFGGNVDGINVENMLWLIVAMQASQAVIMTLNAVFKSVNDFNCKLHFKEDYETSDTDYWCLRWAACCQNGVTLIFLWAAYNFDKAAADTDFTFPLISWVIMAQMFVFWVYQFLTFQDSYEVFAIIQGMFYFTALPTAVLVGWRISCSLE